MEFELQPSGSLRYANNSNYKDESMIRKKLYVNHCVMQEFERIVEDSGILEQDDTLWPEPDRRDGMQELNLFAVVITSVSIAQKLNSVSISEDLEITRPGNLLSPDSGLEIPRLLLDQHTFQEPSALRQPTYINKYLQ